MTQDIEAVRSDLALLDSVLVPSDRKKELLRVMGVLQAERKDLEMRMRLCSQKLAQEEELEVPFKRAAVSRALDLEKKYGRSVGELRELVALVS